MAEHFCTNRSKCKIYQVVNNDLTTRRFSLLFSSSSLWVGNKTNRTKNILYNAISGIFSDDSGTNKSEITFWRYDKEAVGVSRDAERTFLWLHVSCLKQLVSIIVEYLFFEVWCICIWRGIRFPLVFDVFFITYKAGFCKVKKESRPA